MKFSDFPIEIQNKVKERVEEQGRKYSPNVFDYDIYSDKYKDGFNWWQTIEGDLFWEKVLTKKQFDIFFEKYPQEEICGFKIGDKVNHVRFPHLIFEIIGFNIHDNSVLIFSELFTEGHGASTNDLTHGKRKDYSFGHFFAGVKNISHLKEQSISKNDSDDIWIGDTVEVIAKNDDAGFFDGIAYIGLKFKITNVRSCSKNEFNHGSKMVHFNNNEYCVNWTRNMLKKVSPEETNSNNLNIINNGESTSSPIIFGFTISLDRGSPVRGAAIKSSNQEIRVGN